MALSVRVICRPHLAAAFELTGLAVDYASDASDAAGAVTRAAADPGVGMVLMDDGLYLALPRELTARLDRQALPIVAPFPSPAWDALREADAYVLEILRQAIGYRVRPR